MIETCTRVLISYCKIYAVSPCHHGMGCPQISDTGTASDMEGNCECIE